MPVDFFDVTTEGLTSQAHDPPIGSREMSNPLLDMLGPAVLGPAIVALFWGSSTTFRVILGGAIHVSLTIAFGLALWLLSRRAPHRSELGETIWSCASGLLASTMPWIISPQTRWGHFALGFIFAVIVSNDTLFAALRQNRVWRIVLVGTSLSYGVFLATHSNWVLGLCCVLYALTLVGGHDAIQVLLRSLRHQHAASERLALTDPLTGLANRRGLTRYIADAAQDPGAELRLALIDIDDFKRINDRHGHVGGDMTLLCLADHLRSTLGGDWLICRSGGDEFVCASTVGSLDDAIRALRAVPSESFEDAIIPINVSGGLAVGPPDDTILADASAALRLAKQRGKHEFTIVDDELRAALNRERSIGALLPGALERDEIKIWAQPIVRTADRSVHSYECLARWSTPDGQNVPPGIFIPMIEDQRLTRELGESVIRQAAEFAVALDEDTAVAVNVSVSHFVDPSFIPFVHRTLQRHRLAPNRLTIEITESEDAPSADEAWGVARQLEQMGVGLAIDDFGTGYASLERILRFPCSQLKLDRSIAANVAGTGLEHLLAGFGSMSAQSGMQVVAEGIEEEEQHDLLAELGLPLAQGYLYARPRPIDEVLRDLPDRPVNAAGAEGRTGRPDISPTRCTTPDPVSEPIVTSRTPHPGDRLANPDPAQPTRQPSPEAAAWPAAQRAQTATSSVSS